MMHFVEFLYPNILTSDTSIVEVSDRKIECVTMPEGSFGFRFVDQEQAIVNGEVLKGAFKDYSGWFYKGRRLSLDDVKKEMPDSNILISNMKCNGWAYVVKTKFGQCFPLEEKDVVIGED